VIMWRKWDERCFWEMRYTTFHKVLCRWAVQDKVILARNSSHEDAKENGGTYSNR
jgi:hypothetical protein